MANAFIPPYGIPAVRRSTDFRMTDEDDPWLKRFMGFDTSVVPALGAPDQIQNDIQSPEDTVGGGEPVPERPGFFSRLRSTIQSHPRETQGFLGAIMGIPQGGGFLEGLQGGLGGYMKGAAGYDAKQAALAKAELDRRRVVAQERGPEYQWERNEIMRNRPTGGRDPVQDARNKLKWYMGLTSEEQQGYRHMTGHYERTGTISSPKILEMLGAGVKKLVPGISDEDALILAKFVPSKTAGESFMDLMRPSEEMRKGGVMFRQRTTRNYTWTPQPMAAIVLKKYNLDPQKFYNDLNYDAYQKLDQGAGSEPGASTSASGQTPPYGGPYYQEGWGEGGDEGDQGPVTYTDEEVQALIEGGDPDDIAGVLNNPDLTDDQAAALMSALGRLVQDPQSYIQNWATHGGR